MKSLILSLFIIIASSLSALAQDDAIMKYFSKYVDDEKFSAVYISLKMIGMIAKVEIEDMEPEVQEVVRSMK